MSTCGFCDRAGFSECLCGVDPSDAAAAAGRTLPQHYVEEGWSAGVRDERLRLRPLLEQCEALARAQLHLHQRPRRPDAEAVALFGNLLAEICRELGKEG